MKTRTQQQDYDFLRDIADALKDKTDDATIKRWRREVILDLVGFMLGRILFTNAWDEEYDKVNHRALPDVVGCAYQYLDCDNFANTEHAREEDYSNAAALILFSPKVFERAMLDPVARKLHDAFAIMQDAYHVLSRTNTAQSHSGYILFITGLNNSNTSTNADRLLRYAARRLQEKIESLDVPIDE